MEHNKKVNEITRAVEVNSTKRFSVSSDAPIYNGAYGEYQILSHDIGSINLEPYRKSGVPLLRDHEDKVQLGTVECDDVEVVDGKLYVKTIIWRSDDLSQTYKTDFESGAIRNVSIRAKPEEIIDAGRYEDRPLVRITKWSPREISLVSIPADNSVGINRSNKESINKNKEYQSLSSINMSKETEQQNISDSQEFQKELQRKLQENEIKVYERLNYIDEMSTKYNLAPEVRRKLIHEKATNEQVLAEVVRKQEDFAKNRKDEVTGEPQPIAQATSEVYRNEGKKYNLAEVIRSITAQNYNTKEYGFAREVSKELARGVDLPPDTIFIPYGALVSTEDMVGTQLQRSARRQELQRSFTADPLTPTTLYTADFIDVLRDKNILMRLGANVLTGLQGMIEVGTLNPGTEGTRWLPDPGADANDVTQGNPSPPGNAIAVANPIAQKVMLKPRRLANMNTISNFNMNQTPYALESIIRRDMMNAINESLQRALFTGAAVAGSGSSLTIANVPNGPANLYNQILAANRTNATDAAGVELAYGQVVDLVASVGDSNGIVNESNTALVTSFSGRAALFKISTRNTYPLLAMGSAPSQTGDGMQTLPVIGIGERVATTNSVRHGYGSGNNAGQFDCFYGDWSQIYIGMFGGGIMSTIGTNGTDFQSDRTSIRSIMTTDIVARNRASFGVLTGRK